MYQASEAEAAKKLANSYYYCLVLVLVLAISYYHRIGCMIVVDSGSRLDPYYYNN